MSSPLPTSAVGRALRLVAAVHDYDETSIAELLQSISKYDLHATTVALAAMVNVDATPSELLAWNDAPETGSSLLPHGTHAAFNRHKKRGDSPCDDCVTGERRYQRLRNRRRRLEKAS